MHVILDLGTNEMTTQHWALEATACSHPVLQLVPWTGDIYHIDLPRNMQLDKTQWIKGG